MCSCNQKLSIECILHRRNAHSQDSIQCIKHYEDLVVNEMDTKFYCKTCLDMLVNYYASLFNATSVDAMVNFLDSFNMYRVLNDQEDIDAG